MPFGFPFLDIYQNAVQGTPQPKMERWWDMPSCSQPSMLKGTMPSPSKNRFCLCSASASRNKGTMILCNCLHRYSIKWVWILNGFPSNKPYHSLNMKVVCFPPIEKFLLLNSSRSTVFKSLHCIVFFHSRLSIKQVNIQFNYSPWKPR